MLTKLMFTFFIASIIFGIPGAIISSVVWGMDASFISYCISMTCISIVAILAVVKIWRDEL